MFIVQRENEYEKNCAICWNNSESDNTFIGDNLFGGVNQQERSRFAGNPQRLYAQPRTSAKHDTGKI